MIVHNSYPLAEPRVEREAQALIQRGYEVDVLCLRRLDEIQFEVVDGVNIHRLPVRRDKRRGFAAQFLEYLAFFILVFFKVFSLHSSRKYETVEVHNLPDFLVFSALWPKLTGAKVFLNIHDVMPEFFAVRLGRPMKSKWVLPVLWQERLSCWFADHVIIATHRWRNALIERGIPAEKISVVLNLADERIFKRPSRSKEYMTKEMFIVIYHGTITPRYGVDLAIQAVNYLRERLPSIRLWLVGRGEYLEDAISLVKDLNLQDFVIFKDIVPLKDLPALLMQADIGVASYKFDGFTDGCLPTKLLEYTALGIPSVVAPTPVIKDYFDETMVEFCAPEDAKGLADHIYLLYSNPGRYNELARNTAKFNERYNWTNQAEEYAKLVKSMRK
jgi:glycosyltransferase involved in cell wall biosynthesis